VQSDRLKPPPRGGLYFNTRFSVFTRQPGALGPRLEIVDGQEQSGTQDVLPVASPPGAALVFQTRTDIATRIASADLARIADTMLVSVSSGTCPRLVPHEGKLICGGTPLQSTVSFLLPATPATAAGGTR
jgi:hypothetical protein